MALGRIVRGIRAEKYSPIRLRWLTRTFVSSDVISFLVQGTGAGMMSTGGNFAGVAKAIVITGLVIQVIMFGFFFVTLRICDQRIKDNVPTAISIRKTHLLPLYIICALIMVRSIFRVIEYAMGQTGYLLSHEWSMYIFDSVLMFCVMAVWIVRHPGCLQSDAQDENLDFEDA